MVRKITGPEIERVIQLLGRLPGLGRRSARKAVLHLLKHRHDLLIPLADALRDAAEKLVDCAVCGNIDTASPCAICGDPRRDRAMLVVVEDVADLWALERADAVKGMFHVLGGHLSPLDGIGPDQLNIPGLIERAHDPAVCEVVLALNVTVEGQSTAHYLMEALKGANVEVTRLAQGVPVGGELDYLDDGTLAAAIKSRRRIDG
ncbi:MAG TPA: recombination mediator RecR [Hyphomicrobiaceae bacterium]|nr:recombination mediator RecR [Hyphomicrobiaceae bacterium]